MLLSRVVGAGRHSPGFILRGSVARNQNDSFKNV